MRDLWKNDRGVSGRRVVGVGTVPWTTKRVVTAMDDNIGLAGDAAVVDEAAPQFSPHTGA